MISCLPSLTVDAHNGVTVLYDGSALSYHTPDTLPGLPSLPEGTRMATVGPAMSSGYDGYLTIAGHLSLTPGDGYYDYSRQLRRGMEVRRRTCDNRCDGACAAHASCPFRLHALPSAIFPGS